MVAAGVKPEQFCKIYEEDFNSYATHPGNHLTAQRATFANPKLVNEMVRQDGSIKQGLLARLEPDGKVVRMWDLLVRATSMGKLHQAMMDTAAVAIGAAAAIPGTLVNRAAGGADREAITIGYPSGTLRVGAQAGRDGDE